MLGFARRNGTCALTRAPDKTRMYLVRDASITDQSPRHKCPAQAFPSRLHRVVQKQTGVGERIERSPEAFVHRRWHVRGGHMPQATIAGGQCLLEESVARGEPRASQACKLGLQSWMSESWGLSLGSLLLRVVAAVVAWGGGLGCSVFDGWVGKVGTGRCSGGLEGDLYEKL